MKECSNFFKEKITRIFTDKKTIVDIGGGLRISKTKGDSYSSSGSWILPYLNKVEYKILDPVPDYNPDIIGDIHNLPFGDNSQDAVICISVLEHVENPIKASKELYRVLRMGGYCLVSVPFLHCYHAKEGYYKDYWRFTKDTLGLLFNGFEVIEIQQVSGAIATLLKMTPLYKFKILRIISDFIDRVFHKDKSRQTSGFLIFLVK